MDSPGTSNKVMTNTQTMATVKAGLAKNQKKYKLERDKIKAHAYLLRIGMIKQYLGILSHFYKLSGPAINGELAAP